MKFIQVELKPEDTCRTYVFKRVGAKLIPRKSLISNILKNKYKRLLSPKDAKPGDIIISVSKNNQKMYFDSVITEKGDILKKSLSSIHLYVRENSRTFSHMVTDGYGKIVEKVYVSEFKMNLSREYYILSYDQLIKKINV